MSDEQRRKKIFTMKGRLQYFGETIVRALTLEDPSVNDVIAGIYLL